MRGISSNKSVVVKRRKPLFESLEIRQLFSTITVGPTNAYQYQTISAAVTAVTSPNTTITVAPGTYTEQVQIEAPAADAGLRIIGSGAGSSIIQAPVSLVGNGAIVEITGVQNVTVSGFTITGGSGVDGLIYGVLVDGGTGASAVISNDTISNIEQVVHLGDDTGFGVAVTSGTAQVNGCTISGYERDGILVAPVMPSSPSTALIGPTGPATTPPSATISADTINGSTSTNLTVHNGIEFDDGAKGSILNTTVENNENTLDDTYYCTGILLNNTGVVGISGGSVSYNDNNMGIFGTDFGGNSYYGSKGCAINSITVDNASYDGIDVFYGVTKLVMNKVTAEYNGQTAYGNGLYIDPSCTGNTIENSTFAYNDANGGGYADIEDDSTDAGTFGSGNTYLNDTTTDGPLASNYTKPVDFQN